MDNITSENITNASLECSTLEEYSRLRGWHILALLVWIVNTNISRDLSITLISVHGDWPDAIHSSSVQEALEFGSLLFPIGVFGSAGVFWRAQLSRPGRLLLKNALIGSAVSSTGLLCAGLYALLRGFLMSGLCSLVVPAFHCHFFIHLILLGGLVYFLSLGWVAFDGLAQVTDIALSVNLLPKQHYILTKVLTVVRSVLTASWCAVIWSLFLCTEMFRVYVMGVVQDPFQPMEICFFPHIPLSYLAVTTPFTAGTSFVSFFAYSRAHRLSVQLLEAFAFSQAQITLGSRVKLRRTLSLITALFPVISLNLVWQYVVTPVTILLVKLMESRMGVAEHALSQQILVLCAVFPCMLVFPIVTKIRLQRLEQEGFSNFFLAARDQKKTHPTDKPALKEADVHFQELQTMS